ncbi:MAG: hypothetical protein A2283_08755 [Lentisphaerae bacterium RIFOXYA12_FULL_48_11]|nr:MAG: hypothetical protein A2283_08755 [Lentisphaerae bacterium RIFOXYA12_FULL_48_11]
MRQGCVFDIQRFSIHDGPGIRTTVFLKGCPLHCLWCGNPESINPRPQLSYMEDRCIACSACLNACKANALTIGGQGKIVVDWNLCTQCGECAAACDPKALEMVGRKMTVEDVMKVVLSDRDYYRPSGGGLTLSGGEPLFQSEFSTELLKAARRSDLHCCVETSGHAAWSSFEKIMPQVDLWLYDYKETDPDLHHKFTGRDNKLILDNLKKLHDSGAHILIRCPMIPAHNVREHYLEGIVALCRGMPLLQGVELLPYFDLWRGKLKRFGLKSEFPDTVKPPAHETAESWKAYLRERGVRVI